MVSVQETSSVGKVLMPCLPLHRARSAETCCPPTLSRAANGHHPLAHGILQVGVKTILTEPGLHVKAAHSFT